VATRSPSSRRSDGQPVHEILEGWHVERGYMWPYVLLTYLLSPLVVGLLLNPG
jgi:hypothetical protein